MAYRLGFLLCDHVLEQAADQFPDYPDMFAAAFAEVTDAIEWQVFDLTREEMPAHANACDGYLVSGSRHGAYDALPWIPGLEQFIRDVARSGRPMVGLCFGHQIVGQALGGRVEIAPQGWGLGIREVAVTMDEPWMRPQRERFAVPVCHQDQVTALPPGAVRLASNGHCENFIVRFTDRILGIQGHPEFSVDFMGMLVQWRKDRMPEETYLAALESLGRAHHNRILKQWIVTFLGIPEKGGAAHAGDGEPVE
jgi:GMP synthase-like glutamine amidotransferase